MANEKDTGAKALAKAQFVRAFVDAAQNAFHITVLEMSKNLNYPDDDRDEEWYREKYPKVHTYFLHQLDIEITKAIHKINKRMEGNVNGE